MKNYFIALEGIDGVGKSTHAQFLYDFLRNAHIPVIHTREPGGTLVGEHLRDCLLHMPMCSKTELLLQFAIRAEHWETVIYPALQQKQWVICERFSESSYAYQGGGRGIDSHTIAQLEKIAHDAYTPDVVLLFDAPVEIARTRLNGRAQDRLEKENAHFYEKVRATYLHRAKENPALYRVIDATLPLSSIRNYLELIINYKL